jgi:preprotein translocase subunit SecA
VERYTGKDREADEWDVPALGREVSRVFGVDPREIEALDLSSKSPEEMTDALWALIKGNYEAKEQLVGAEILRRVERDIMLQIVDAQWKDHLYSLDHLKEGIGLRGYGQRDPLVEYKKESFSLFQDMKARIEEEMIRYLFWLRPVISDEGGGETPPPMPVPQRQPARRQQAITMNNPSAAAVPAFAGARTSGGGGAAAAETTPRPARTGGDDVVKTVRREEPKVGRNDPCPCGSGRKYKKCHGAAA